MEVIKLIICDGDSWTAGDIVDPELFGDNLSEVDHPDNDQYRLPRVWPHKLGNSLGIDVLNTSYSGSSNDSIVRRVLRNTLEQLETYNSEELFVIVGWSSPERKDFFYEGEFKCFYPMEFGDLKGKTDIDKFKKLYLKYFWEGGEYVTRYVQQNLLLHTFLENRGIKHYFFDAFYEKKRIESNKDGGMYSNVELENEIDITNPTFEYYLKIRPLFTKDKSFRSFLMVDEENFDDELWDWYHPSEKAHELWAEELYKDLNEKFGI